MVWDGRTASGQIISSGVYFYRLSAPQTNIVRKMMYLK
jgi:hypothetical protein